MNILSRLKRLEVVTVGGGLCDCRRQSLRVKAVEPADSAESISLIVLPCERCGKAVSHDLPPVITFEINPNGNSTKTAQ